MSTAADCIMRLKHCISQEGLDFSILLCYSTEARKGL